MSLSEKYTAECLAQGFEYVGKSSRKDYSIVRCMVCGDVGEYQQGHIRSGRVRCKACHETKMKNECLAEGFVWIRKVDGFNSLCRCLTCGHEDTFRQDSMRNGMVKCSHCHETKMKQECLGAGFEWLSKVDKNSSLCRCLACGHEDVFEQGAMRDGRVKCSACYETKMKNECSAQGFEWINKVDMHNSLCRCQTCGHIDIYQQSNMRKGNVACSNCLVEKWTSECSEQGFKFIRKVDGKISRCECLMCGHIDTYHQSQMRNGNVACSNCSPGHWNEECFFYMARIIHGNSTIIKIGVAADPHKRYTQYGLKPDADITEILRLRFDTKLEAVEFESNMKTILKPFHIHRDAAKLILTYSGFTECYSSDAEDVVKESFI